MEQEGSPQGLSMKEIWSPKALLQLEGLWNFIANDSEAAADSVVQRIFESVDLLKTQPEMGRPGRLAGTRELVVPRTPYFLVYRIRRGGIELIAVLHGSQRWP